MGRKSKNRYETNSLWFDKTCFKQNTYIHRAVLIIYQLYDWHVALNYFESLNNRNLVIGYFFKIRFS